MRYLVFFAVLLQLGACQSKNELVGLPCPCTSAYVCCESLNQCLAPTAFCPDPIEVANYPQAFTSDSGAKVFLLPVLPLEKNQALVEVVGINHSWDGKVYLHEVKTGAPNGTDYVRKVKGRDYKALIYRKGFAFDYYAYVQGLDPSEIPLTASLELSMQTDPKTIVAAYYAQGGNAAEALPPPLEEFKASEEMVLKAATDDANAACESAVTASFNWPSFDGIEIRASNYSVSKSCAGAMKGIALFCIANSGPAKIRANVKHMECSWGGDGKRAITLQDGKLNFTIDWTRDEDANFVSKYLDAMFP